MPNVLLLSYAGYPYTPSSFCPDNGLALLAGVLREAGHHPLILDFGTVQSMRRLYPEELSRRAAPLLLELSQTSGSPPPELLHELAATNEALERHQAAEVRALADEVAKVVADMQPAFVGFKIWNGDGFSGSVAIAQTLRQRFPTLKLFAGGPHATWMGRVIYEATSVFDAIVLGEAEDKILHLLAYAVGQRPLDGIPGLVRSATDAATPTCSVQLDDLPEPIYDEAVYPAMAGDQKIKLIVLDDSRGCPFVCAFCTHPYESGARSRVRSARRIVDDMERLGKRHGIHAFRLAGSSTPGWLMAEVADEILRRNLHVRYASFAHFASSAPDHFAKMARSGLYAMFFGLESGSQELLRKAAGKTTKLPTIRATVEAAKAAGIFTVCSMIVPLPFETEETFQESLKLLLELRPDSVPVQFPGLLPHTPWFDKPEQYGFEVDREAYLRDSLDYKIKLLFPPAFWKPLPYALNGMAFGEFTQLTARFAQALEANGILTGVPDDNALMAKLAGMSAREFRDSARLWCATGDATAMADFVARCNRCATGEQ